VEVKDKEGKTPLGDVVEEPYRSKEDHGVAEGTVMILLLDNSEQDGANRSYR
jgi:hypothetical protein